MQAEGGRTSWDEDWGDWFTSQDRSANLTDWELEEDARRSDIFLADSDFRKNAAAARCHIRIAFSALFLCQAHLLSTCCPPGGWTPEQQTAGQLATPGVAAQGQSLWGMQTVTVCKCLVPGCAGRSQADWQLSMCIPGMHAGPSS